MGIKLTEWRLKMTENVGSILSRLNSAADKVGGRLDSVQTKLGSGKFNAFTNEIPQAGRAIDLLSSRYALAGAAVAGVGALMYKSTEEALSYERSMAKINATAQLTPPALAMLKDELVAIGENSGGNFMRIPDAFEKINSQVNNVAKSLDILKVANAGAKAGFVDIDLAAGALAQTLSIVGPKADSTEIMDMLLSAKAVGAGEFQDFANYLPQLIAAGSNLNIGHKDVSGLYAYMTAKGQSTSDSAMLLQNAMTAMGKSDIQQGLAKQGIKLFDKDGSVRDLGVFFGELGMKMKKLTPEGKSNFLESVGLRDVQAKNAFSILTADAEKLNSVLGQVRNSQGELNRQLEATENKARSWAEIGDKIKQGMLGLGDKLLPIVDGIINGAEAWAKYFSGTTETQKLYKLQADEKLARGYAVDKVKEKYPQYGPAMFENNGAKLTGDAKKLYEHSYNWDIAKLTGQFGGDYDKFVKDQQAMAAEQAKRDKEAKQPKLGFKADGKHKNIRDGIDNINGGGPRMINVNFQKLMEDVIIQPQTLKEGTNQVVSMTEEMLLRIIFGTEMSLQNS